MADQKIIKLYIGRDDKSAELFRNLSNIIRQIPPEKRPKLKVRVVKIKNPDEFPEFLEQLEEIFGGLYTLEFRKYQIQKLPAIVVDEEKVFEGSFPTKEELIQILAYEGIITREETLTVEKAFQQPMIEREVQKIESVEKHVHEYDVGETYVAKPLEAEEVEKPESKIIEEEPKITEEEPQKEYIISELREAEKIEISKPPVVEKIVEEKASMPTKEVTMPRVEPKKEKTAIKGTCFDCIFFDKSRNRCTLLHVTITDPYHPICGRR
ncbi:MAG: hypothetical protein J7K23_06850 [Thermoproteales archaeon]|nr:hypothetical protein [Thermoproteales archaeon]